jgi:hypothetical protein
MELSTSELHVVYSSDLYSGASMAGESGFSDQSGARALRDFLNAA